MIFRKSRYRIVAILPFAFTAAPALADTVVVVIENMKFNPEAVHVKLGDIVEWQNKDFFPHTATAKKVFDSKEIPANSSWKFKTKKKGKFPYVCTLHPTMVGSLIVD
jgi:plastocyanin